MNQTTMSGTIKFKTYFGNEKGMCKDFVEYHVKFTHTIEDFKQSISQRVNKPLSHMVVIIRAQVMQDTALMSDWLNHYDELNNVHAYFHHEPIDCSKPILPQLPTAYKKELEDFYTYAQLIEISTHQNRCTTATSMEQVEPTEPLHLPLDDTENSDTTAEEVIVSKEPSNSTAVDELPNDETCTLVNPPTSLQCSACSSNQPAGFKPDRQLLQIKESHANPSTSAGIVDIPQETSGWECSTCTAVNAEAAKTCEVCDAPKPSTKESPNPKETLPAASNAPTNEVQNLQTQDFYLNSENIYCELCHDPSPPGEGIILQSCTHEFCKICIIDYLKAIKPEQFGKCPKYGKDFPDCRIQPSEARALLQDDYEMYEKKERLLYAKKEF